MGSSAWIEDAVWIDNDRFILAGIHSDEQSQRIPYIIIGSIKDKSLQAYHCTGKACIQTIGYKAANIGKIKLKTTNLIPQNHIISLFLLGNKFNYD